MSHKSREPWPIEYAADLAHLSREKERFRREFKYASPQIQYRAYLVGWVCSTAEKLKLCTCTVHLSIYIMDLFMDNHHIAQDRLHLVALTCILIAAKYEEYDAGIPKIAELNSVVNSRYLNADFKNVEILILSLLDWNLNLPTAAHFAEYFSLFTVSRKDWDPIEYTLYETFWRKARRIVHDYLNTTLLDVCILQFLPSLVAASCILLARQQLCLNKWSEELITVTKYSREDLIVCADFISSKSNTTKIDRKRKYVASPDMGYATEENSPEKGHYKKRHVKSKSGLKV